MIVGTSGTSQTILRVGQAPQATPNVVPVITQQPKPVGEPAEQIPDTMQRLVRSRRFVMVKQYNIKTGKEHIFDQFEANVAMKFKWAPFYVRP